MLIFYFFSIHQCLQREVFNTHINSSSCFRVLNGIIILGKACDLIEGAEKRRGRQESVSDSAEKSSNINEKGKAPSTSSKETLKVEVATSPIRGWSMPPQTLASGERVQVKRQSLEVSASASASTSIVSTPSPSDLPIRSNSLDFLGESKKGLMANSMVNLSSVGINEGPFTHDASRQYRLQHSLESIVSVDNSDGGESGSELQGSSSLTHTPPRNVLFQNEQAERIQTVSPAKDTSREEHSSGTEGVALDEASEAQKFKRYPFVSCDSIRYRGSTDGDIL